MGFVQKFYTADLHFGHDAMRRFQPESRAFASVEDMDRAIIERIRERVGKEDMLYILGDFALSKDDAYVRHCFNELPGKKFLILGNHDVDRDGSVRKVIAGLKWEQPPVHAMSTKEDGGFVWLSHYGHRVWPGSHKGAWHFYGHSHSRLASMGRSRDVGIDMPDTGFGPRTFAELTKNMMQFEPADAAEVYALEAEMAAIMPPVRGFSLSVPRIYWEILKTALIEIKAVIDKDNVHGFQLTKVLVADDLLVIRPDFSKMSSGTIPAQIEIQDIILFAELQADEIRRKEIGGASK